MSRITFLPFKEAVQPWLPSDTVFKMNGYLSSASIFSLQVGLIKAGQSFLGCQSLTPARLPVFPVGSDLSQHERSAQFYPFETGSITNNVTQNSTISLR